MAEVLGAFDPLNPTKKKKPSAFDAFFAAADAGTAEDAQNAFDQVNQVNMAQQSFDTGGFDSFFKTADEIAAANSNVDPVADIVSGSNGAGVVSTDGGNGSSASADIGPTNPLFSSNSGDGGQGDRLRAAANTPEVNTNTGVNQEWLDRVQAQWDAPGAGVGIGHLDTGGQNEATRAALLEMQRAEIAKRAAERERAQAITLPAPAEQATNNAGSASTQDVVANSASGLNTDIVSRLADSAGLDLAQARSPEEDRLAFLDRLVNRDDELRRNQQALLADILNQSDAAGQQAVTNLAIPDVTKTNVPPRVLSSLEQATQKRLEDRLTGGRFIDPNSALTGSAEQVILDRLQGGDNPAIAAQRAEFLAQSGKTQDQLIADLNRLGVLRSGDTADVIGDFLGQRDRGIGDINARAFDLQSQAINDALGFQGRRDQLGLAEQDLQRAAISDAQSFTGQRDARDFTEAQLTGALRGEATLPARLAQAGLQFDAANLQQDVADRTLNRLLTQTAPTQREIFSENVRNNQVGNVLNQGQDVRAGQALGSDLSTADLNRRIAESGVTGQFDTGAANQAPIQTQQAQQQAFNQLLQRAGLTGNFEGQRTEQGLTNDLNRLLAGNQDTRAEDFQNRTFDNQRISQILAAAKDGIITEGAARNAVLEALNLGSRDNPEDPRSDPVDPRLQIVEPGAFNKLRTQILEHNLPEDAFTAQGTGDNGGAAGVRRVLSNEELGRLGLLPGDVSENGIVQFDPDPEAVARNAALQRQPQDVIDDILNRVKAGDQTILNTDKGFEPLPGQEIPEIIPGADLSSNESIAQAISSIEGRLQDGSLSEDERQQLRGQLGLLQLIQANKG